MRGLLPTLLLVLTAGSVVHAQAAAVGDRELPATEQEDSVFWWTLTDELSPEELRAIHENNDLHRQRYLQAVAAGYRDPLPEDRLQAITSFFTGQMTPELFPMWRAFNAFSTHFYGDSRWKAFSKAPKQLARYGIEDAAAESIIDAALRQLDESQALVRENTPDTLRFLEFAREAKTKLGERAVKESLARRDATTIALATGRSPAFVAKLMKAWQREPIRETVVVVLPELKAKLTSTEWERFRLFLLKEVAPMISTIDFAREGE